MLQLNRDSPQPFLRNPFDLPINVLKTFVDVLVHSTFWQFNLNLVLILPPPPTPLDLLRQPNCTFIHLSSIFLAQELVSIKFDYNLNLCLLSKYYSRFKHPLYGQLSHSFFDCFQIYFKQTFYCYEYTNLKTTQGLLNWLNKLLVEIFRNWL